MLNDIATEQTQLYIHLPVNFEAAPDSCQVQWSLQPGCNQPESLHAVAQCQWQSSPLNELPPLPENNRVIVLIPTEWLLLTSIALPEALAGKAKKQLQQALPYLIEEHLAADIEEQHLAISKIDKGAITVAIMARLRLVTFLDILKQQNIVVDALIPDGLCIPLDTKQPQASLFLEPARASLRTAENLAISVSLDNLTALLDSWAAESENQSLHIISSNPETLENQRVAIESCIGANGIALTFATSTQENLAADINTWDTDLNLLQGEFAPVKKRIQNKSSLRLPAIAASLAAITYISYLLISGFYFNWQANQQYQASRELYKTYFPNDRRIVNIRTQTRNHLSGSNQQQNDGFLNLLEQFVSQWQPQAKHLQMQQIRFNRQRQELIIELNSQSIAQLDQLRNQLASQGLKSELLSAIEEGQGVRGRIKLTQPSGGRS